MCFLFKNVYISYWSFRLLPTFVYYSCPFRLYPKNKFQGNHKIRIIFLNVPLLSLELQLLSTAPTPTPARPAVSHFPPFIITLPLVPLRITTMKNKARHHLMNLGHHLKHCIVIKNTKIL